MAFKNYPRAAATVTVSEPVEVTPAYNVTEYSYGFEGYAETVTPAQQIYAEDFSANLGGWTNGSNSSLSYNASLRLIAVLGTTPTPNGVKQARRTLTDLVVGRVYTFSANVSDPWSEAATYFPGGGRVGIDGIGYSAYTVPSGPTKHAVTFTFTATAASHVLLLEHTVATAPSPSFGWIGWADIALTRDAYTTVTNNGRDGFSSGTVQTATKRRGSYALSANAPARAFTGLVVGHYYSLTGWHSTGGAWTDYVQTFQAVATSMSRTLNVAGTRFWDDVALIHHVPPVTTLTPVLKLSDGDLALDSGKYPYAQSAITVPMPDADLLEQIEPGQRVNLNASALGAWVSGAWVPSAGITADLHLVEREASHDGKELQLRLASDEAILDTWAPLTDDLGPRVHEANLRNLCNYILNKTIPGAALQSGMANADLTATWDATNLQTNPSAGANLDGWTATGGTTSRITGTSVPGTSITTAVRSTMGAGQPGGLYFNGGDDSSIAGGVYNVRLSGKQLYRVSAWVRTSVSKTIRLSVQQRNSGNTPSGANLNGPDFTTTANTWHRLTYVFQAYPETVRMGVYCYLTSGAWSAGQTIDMTGVMVTEGTADTPSFDGSTTIRTDLYTYTWSGTPHLSASKRTALVDRSPELFTWRAGESAWKFLEPLTTSAGLRLFCDEQRHWWLIDPAEWTVPGRFSARPDNTVEGTDAMDADDDETGVSGVVTVFKWRDSEGVSREQSESAGVPGKVKTLEFNRPFTPGVAAAHLGKVQGQNRTQDVTVGIDYSVRPGQEVQIDLPGTNAQLGTVTGVKFELTNGLMGVQSAGLRDTPPGSIDLLNGTIDGLTGTIDSL